MSQSSTCDHAESLYGRCTACGKTWEQQAREQQAKEREADHLPPVPLGVRRWIAKIRASAR